MEKLQYQQGSLSLQRFPLRSGDPLRAWDAADEHILKHLAEEPAGQGARVLIFNDAFGALAVALQELKPQVWSDSDMAARGLAHNLVANGFDVQSVPFVGAHIEPAGPFDLVLLKLPKSLAHFEDTLLRLRPLLHADSRIITGGMIKHTPARAYQLLEQILGPTTTSQGWKKSRLAFSTFDPAIAAETRLPEAVYSLEDYGLDLANAPNVFSRDHLDLGTRFLLPQLPRLSAPLKALDVGSGNGVLALVLAGQCPAAEVLGLDESFQAVECAARNAETAGLQDRVRFEVASDLQDLVGESFDLVVCNPPFHQGQATGDQLAWGMLHQSRRVLKNGGRLLVVGNRHLGYHVKFMRLFGDSRLVASDKKFVVLEAIKGQ